jgi:hypothetical protein
MAGENVTFALLAATDRAAVLKAGLAEHELAAQPLRNTFAVQTKLLPAVIEANRRCADARRATERIHARQTACLTLGWFIFCDCVVADAGSVVQFWKSCWASTIVFSRSGGNSTRGMLSTLMSLRLWRTWQHSGALW